MKIFPVIKPNNYLGLAICFLIVSSMSGQKITTGSLLEEMIDLDRLTTMSRPGYETIQFSSYDRSSTSLSDPGWFQNNDGFGNEPNPNFEAVLREPDEDGIGTYLVSDVEGPGAIVRFWTVMTGKLSIYLDGAEEPVFEGQVRDFLPQMLSGSSLEDLDYEETFRQFDALYFPIAFSESCRIEWTGNVRELHFYHVNMKLYEEDVQVETFKPGDFITYAARLEKVNRVLLNPSTLDATSEAQRSSHTIAARSNKDIIAVEGDKAINYFSLKLEGGDPNLMLRKNILNIYFDDASIPQVQSPVGDFFGAAPGINPLNSLPFTVLEDGTLICRFLMPFERSARVEILNNTDEEIRIQAAVATQDYNWEEEESMYFSAKWRIDHGVTASNKDIIDVPYLLALGKGRIVGGATFLFNPSNIPHSGGSWWGEGDEKIFIDDDTFPSFYGTGSEDYYNYSWSSPELFSYPFSGQPRNDGPGNRGFVTNFRWHIIDDIPFQDKLAFYMELFHHEEALPGFSYGRMVYLYARPNLLTDHMVISEDDLREIQVPRWSPEARNAATGFMFIEGENLVEGAKNTSIEENRVWSRDSILMWRPTQKGEQLKFTFDNPTSHEGFLMTMANTPAGGKFSLKVNGKPVKLDQQEVVDLQSEYHTMLRAYTTEQIQLRDAGNEVILESKSERNNTEIGLDFIWVREE